MTNQEKTTYTTDEFASILKKKYPAYQDRDNSILVDAWLKKYPVYKDRISPAVSKPTAPELPQFAVTSPVGTMTARGAISETTIPAEMPDTGVPVGEMVAGVVQPVLQSKPAQFLLGELISKERTEDWSETVGRKYPESEILQKGVAAIGAVGQIITPLDLLLYGTGMGIKAVKQGRQAYKSMVSDFAKVGEEIRLAPGYELTTETAKALAEAKKAESLTAKALAEAKKAESLAELGKKFQPVAATERLKPGLIKQKPVKISEELLTAETALEKMGIEKAQAVGFTYPAIKPKQYKPVIFTPKPIKTIDDYVDNVVQEEAPKVIDELGVNNNMRAINNLEKAGVKVNKEAVEILPEAPSMFRRLTEQAKKSYDDGMNYFIRSLSTGMKKQGIYGTWMANKLQYIRDEAGIRLGTTITEIMPSLKTLSKSELEQLRKAQDLGEEITSPKVQMAYDVIKAKADDIGRTAQELGMTIKARQITPTGEIETAINPWMPKKNFFPHSHDFAKLLSSSEEQERFVAHLVKTKQAENSIKAKDALALYLSRNMTRRVGNLEFSRTLDLPGYDTNPITAWEKYFRNAYHRIEEVRAFGPTDEKVKFAISKIQEQGGNAVYAREAFDRAVKIHRDEITGRQVMGAARNLTILTKMHLSAITNMQQMGQIAAVTNLNSFAKGLSQIFTKEGKEFAMKAGVVLNSTLNSLMREGMGSSLLAEKYLKAVGMTTTERFLRTFASLSGRQMLADTFKVIKKTPTDKSAQSLLLKMGFDPKQLVKKTTLSEHDFLMAGRNLVQRTQFLTDPLDLPLFATSPWGRLMLQLKTFAIQQTKFVKDDLLKEAARGNVKPLIKFTMAADVLGEGVQDIKAFIKRKDRQYDMGSMERHIENIVGGGALGILQDVYHNISGVNPNLGLLVTPVAFAPLSDIAVAGKYAITGEGKKAARKIAPDIPFIGPTLSGLLKEQSMQRKRKKYRK